MFIPVSGAPGVDEGNAGAALRRIVPPLQTLIARSLNHGLQNKIPSKNSNMFRGLESNAMHNFLDA